MKKQICYLLVLIQLVVSIEEAMDRLEKDGVKVNHAHIRLIHPFPTDELLPLVENAKKVAVVENNATGQLANIIKMNVGHAEKINKVLKYDGNPFIPYDVYESAKIYTNARSCSKWQHLKTFVIM